MTMALFSKWINISAPGFKPNFFRKLAGIVISPLGFILFDMASIVLSPPINFTIPSMDLSKLYYEGGGKSTIVDGR